MKKSKKKIMALFILSTVLTYFSCSTTKPIKEKAPGNGTFYETAIAEKKPEEKNALVLGGGGGKGAYHIGVFRALKELKYPIHIVTGTSVGALNAFFVVTDDLEGAENLWENISPEIVFSEPAVMNNDSVYDDTDFTRLFSDFITRKQDNFIPLQNLIHEVFDLEKFVSSSVDFGTIALDMKSLRPKIIIKGEVPPEKIPEYMLASAACYPSFEPYVVDGIPYVDGGYTDNVPAEIAKRLGADSYVIVNLNSLGIISEASKKIIREEKCVYISSYWNLGSLLNFNPEQSRRNLRLGYLDGLKAFGVYEGRAYTFEREAFANESGAVGTMEKWVEFLPVKKILHDHWENKFTAEKSVLTLAEICAEIFDVSPLVLYSREKFNTSLTEKIAQSSLEDKKSSAAITLGLVKEIKKARAKVENKAEIFLKELEIPARKNPKEFCAALYLVITEIPPEKIPL